MISARAYGILSVIANTGVKISADTLSEYFSEGRDAIQAALKELREAGLIETYKVQNKGRWSTCSQVSDLGHRALKIPLRYRALKIPLLYEVHSNSNSILANADLLIANSKKRITGEPSGVGFKTLGIEVKDMGYEFFGPTSEKDSDAIQDRTKAQASKKADYEKARSVAIQQNGAARAAMPKSQWSCLDVAREFADQVKKHWHIKPWQVNQSRFVPALGTARKQHDTNGEIELKAMEMFFASISFEKYDDAEQLWKLFILRLPSLVVQVKHETMPAEESEEELRLKAKALSRLRGISV